MSNPDVTVSASAMVETPANRHLLTAVEKQRSQLDRLMKDPSKAAFIPTTAKEKTIRPPREMMKNVQGSSAGAGSGEFHVYKAGRRREYERLKILEDQAQKEIIDAEFDSKRKEAEMLAESKTAKNRAKRQKKKERAKGKGPTTESDDGLKGTGKFNQDDSLPLKKRRLVNGTEIVFRKEGFYSEEGALEPSFPNSSTLERNLQPEETPRIPVVEEQRLVIHDD